MKINKRVLVFLLVFTIGIMQLGSYSALASEKKSKSKSEEIEVILNVDETVMKKYIESFNKKYPDIKVKYTPYSNYEEDVMKRIDSGKYGDVLYIPSSLDFEGVQKYLEPLGNVTDLSEKYNFVENAYVINDVTYSLPSSGYLKGILYNKEIFDKAGISSIPTTQEEFITDLKLIKDRTDAIPFYTNYETDWVLTDWSFFPYIEMTGDTDYMGLKFVYEKNPFSKGHNFYEVYNLLYNIVDEGLCEKEASASDWGEVCTKVNNGEIGAVVVGTWSYNQMKYAGDNKDSIAYMPFPNKVNGKQYATIGLDYGYCISKNSKHKEAARKFIEYMLDESGYAIDNDRISIVKTDPLPDIYSRISNLEVEVSKSRTEQTYYYNNLLTQGINPESVDAIRQVIDTARNGRSFDSLMQSWNKKWEKARPANMKANNSEYSNVSNSDVQNLIMNNYEVEYSKTEKEYINDKKSIKVGYLTQMAPFQYEDKSVNGKSEFLGLSRVICEAIKDSTKMKIEYIPYVNYEKMVNALDNGDIDLAAGIASDEKYSDNVRLSKSYLELSNVILKSDTLDLDQISGKKEAYVEGCELNTDFITDSKKVSYKSISKLVDAVDKKRVDFAICNYYSANYYMKDGDYTYTSIVPLTEKADYCLAFSNDVDSRLISICNKCIYSFPEESIQIILMQYMDPQAKNITLKRYIVANPIQSGIFVGVLVLFVVGVFLFIKKEKEKSKKKHELDIKRYEILSQLTDEYVFEYDYEGDCVHFDDKFKEKFDFGSDINISGVETDNTALNIFLEDLRKAKAQGRINGEPFELPDCNHQKQWYRMVTYSVMGDKHKPQHVIGKLVNVQQLVEERKKIEKEADRDFLTSLYNRTGFIKRIKDTVVQNTQDVSQVFAVLDLDNFKSVNDSLGHLGGDQALITLAAELDKISDDRIITARYGGDEFVVCMFGISKENADNIFRNLVKVMNRYMTFENKTHELSISLGAVYSDKVESIDLMFEAADKVLYNVKTSGKNSFGLQDYKEE